MTAEMPTKEIRPTETISLELLIFLLILIRPKPESTAPISGKTGINQAISEAWGMF